MNKLQASSREEAVVNAFSKQAAVFDGLYNEDTIIRYKRARVRNQMERFLAPSSQLLELNAGTGEDAIYFAGRGHRVHATDASESMQEIARKKIEQLGLGDQVSTACCSFTTLESLEKRGPYDHLLSNFAGLNCTSQLADVLHSLPPLVKPGGFVTLVILPRYCLWELLLIFRGKFRTAFRRFSGKRGTKAHVEGVHFRCWYYSPSFVRRQLRVDFDVVALEGLCTFVPPSYLEGFAEKRPRFYHFLQNLEERWKNRWPWKSMGDYYIITLKKREHGVRSSGASIHFP